MLGSTAGLTTAPPRRPRSASRLGQATAPSPALRLRTRQAHRRVARPTCARRRQSAEAACSVTGGPRISDGHFRDNAGQCRPCRSWDQGDISATAATFSNLDLPPAFCTGIEGRRATTFPRRHLHCCAAGHVAYRERADVQIIPGVASGAKPSLMGHDCDSQRLPQLATVAHSDGFMIAFFFTMPISRMSRR
jgi:hypothetical protein